MEVLSPVQRAVVELTFFYGYSYPEIAEIVGCPVGTVKTRMFHARRLLKERLPELGLEGELGAR
jgi:RNA polymerase sigma-70 factor (ECF subfamily)